MKRTVTNQNTVKVKEEVGQEGCLFALGLPLGISESLPRTGFRGQGEIRALNLGTLTISIHLWALV